MVGKGEVKSSRIFHQCYVKCCKLQNLTPLNIVQPSSNGKALDFCVDRIKYVDWPPILNALSYDLSLHSISIKCRQQVKTVLEQIDCERLAKTVNKRAVILTNFMLTNLIEALSELLRNTTLLESLMLEGLPIKIPYLNPLCDAILANSSLQHLYLPRCLIGDAGCMALCKVVRCLPNILTLDLSGCDLTPLGAGYIAELIKYQKLHRYSENWIHTLRYRLPELDTMAGLRRISLCGNTQLGDSGVAKLFNELADDLWIKALDIQNCGVTEAGGTAAVDMMRSNTTLVVLDLRYNDVSAECHAKLRHAVRRNEQGHADQYPWLGNMSSGSSDGRPATRQASRTKNERATSKVRNAPKYHTKNAVKKERDSEELEAQLQEEICCRRQLEELNVQLVDQMRRVKQHQIQLWTNGAASSGSEQSFQGSSEHSTSSSSSVPIEQSTLAYIQRAFRDIYAFIRDNQCQGQCVNEKPEPKTERKDTESETDIEIDKEIRMSPRRAQSTHVRVAEKVKRKTTKSAHLLGLLNPLREELRPEMVERNVGDVKSSCENKGIEQKDSKKDSDREVPELLSLGSVSDSSDTLVCSPAPNPRLALFSSSDED